jgi:hypothetical protein
VDGSTVPKTFSVRKDLVGVVEKLDGDNFEIQFRLRSAKVSVEN